MLLYAPSVPNNCRRMTGLLLRGAYHTIVFRTHDRPQNRVFPYAYTQYVALITMFPRNSRVPQ